MESEARLYGDIVVDDMQECYLCLTVKVLRMLKWVVGECRRAEFLVKMDDDVHLNLQKLLGILDPLTGTAEGRNLVGGNRRRAKPLRNPISKWFTPPELWPDSNGRFPVYVGGAAYVLGQDALRKIYYTSLNYPLFHMEDIFVTGIIGSAKLGLTITNFPEYIREWIPLNRIKASSCTIQREYLAVHFIPPWNYIWCWRHFNQNNFVCNDLPLYLYC